MMLSVLGGLLGVLLASFLIKAIITLLPVNYLPIEADIRISIPVLLFTTGATVLAGLIFGCVPAWQSSRVDLNEVLKQGGRTNSGTGKKGIRRALVIAEFALALTTLAAGGLTLKSFWNLSRIDFGVNPDHVLTFALPVPTDRFDERTKIESYYRQILEQIKAVPGVKTVVACSTPFRWPAPPPSTPSRPSRLRKSCCSGRNTG